MSCELEMKDDDSYENAAADEKEYRGEGCKTDWVLT